MGGRGPLSAASLGPGKKRRRARREDQEDLRVLCRKHPNRPVAVIAVGGPSQVGKTEGAYVLEEFLSGSRDNLDVVVGGSFGDLSSRNALIGAPSGYRDSEIGGALTQPARERPPGAPGSPHPRGWSVAAGLSPGPGYSAGRSSARSAHGGLQG